MASGSFAGVGKTFADGLRALKSLTRLGMGGRPEAQLRDVDGGDTGRRHGMHQGWSAVTGLPSLVARHPWPTDKLQID